MSMITVDAEKCNRDGICAAECPARIIELKRGADTPVPIPGAEELCIGCGHCVAVCPTAALSHRHLSPEDCLPVNPDWLMDPEQTEHFLRYRRSIRTYKKQPVDRHTLTRLIDMAHYAPSGHNLQPVQWQVVESPEHVKTLAGHVIDWMHYVIREYPELAGAMHMERVTAAWEAGMDVVLRGAPHLVIAHAGKDDRTAPAACTIALSYLELAAPSVGLGTCWAGYFGAAASAWPGLQEALALPDGNITYGAMMVGYPRFTYHRMPERRPVTVQWV